MVMKFFLLKFCNREILNLLYVCDIIDCFTKQLFYQSFCGLCLGRGAALSIS